MSKKNIKKTSKSSTKSSKKTPKSDYEYYEEDVKEKDEIEKIIKGSKEVKEEIENDVIDSTLNKNIDNKIKNEPKKITPITKRTRKETIIDSILETYEQLNIESSERMTISQLKATKINILEKKLAEMTEKMTKEVMKNQVATSDTPSPDSPISDDLAVQALFNVNIIMTQFVENMAEVGRQNEMTRDYVPNISGLTQKMASDDKQKQLKECLKGIVSQHGESIKPYLSPIAIWLMLIVSTAGETVAENMSKNLEEATPN